MPLDWNAPGLDREYLIGPRFPEDLTNQAYYPDAQFVPHPVPEVRENIWFHNRRLVNLTILNNQHMSAIITLFMPYNEEEPRIFFETIHLIGETGWILGKASDIDEARANHEAVTRHICEQTGLPFPINYTDRPRHR